MLEAGGGRSTLRGQDRARRPVGGVGEGDGTLHVLVGGAAPLVDYRGSRLAPLRYAPAPKLWLGHEVVLGDVGFRLEHIPQGGPRAVPHGREVLGPDLSMRHVAGAPERGLAPPCTERLGHRDRVAQQRERLEQLAQRAVGHRQRASDGPPMKHLRRVPWLRACQPAHDVHPSALLGEPVVGGVDDAPFDLVAEIRQRHEHHREVPASLPGG